MDIKKISDIFLIGFVLAILIFPVIGMVTPIEPDVKLLENRSLSGFPELKPDIDALKKFPSDFKSYFSDNYGFRKYMTWLNIIISLEFLDVPVIKDIIPGKEGWLFWGGDSVIDHCKAGAPLSLETLEKFKKIHEERYHYCAKRGIKYLFIVPPNKSSVYTEYLPDWFSDSKSVSHYRQLVSYLNENTQIEFLDLRQPLIDAKMNEPLYFKADTHWNYMGGFIGYREIIEKIIMWYPHLKPLELSDFTFKTELKKDAELARMIGLTAYLNEPYKTFVPKNKYNWKYMDPDPFYKKHGHEFPRLLTFESNDPSLPKAVMFNDSLTWFMGYFLSNHFSRITYVYEVLGYNNFDTDVIEYEKPDIVLSEIGERFFLNLPDDPVQVN